MFFLTNKSNEMHSTKYNEEPYSEAFLVVVLVFQPEAVRGTILGHLTTLTHLDGVMITEEEASDAIEMVARSKINQV